MVKGRGSEWFLRYKIFNEMEGVGHAPGGPQSVSLDLSYHKEHETWFRSGIRMMAVILDH